MCFDPCLLSRCSQLKGRGFEVGRLWEVASSGRRSMLSLRCCSALVLRPRHSWDSRGLDASSPASSSDLALTDDLPSNSPPQNPSLFPDVLSSLPTAPYVPFSASFVAAASPSAFFFSSDLERLYNHTSMARVTRAQTTTMRMIFVTESAEEEPTLEAASKPDEMVEVMPGAMAGAVRGGTRKMGMSRL